MRTIGGNAEDCRVSNLVLKDPRVRRTRRVLEEAMLSLAEEQDFASITVQDITQRARVNRATFYLHYRDKEDLCARAVDALFDEFTAEDREFVRSHPSIARQTIPPGVLAQFCDMSERPMLYRRLLTETGSSVFASRLTAYYEEQFLSVWHEAGQEAKAGSPPAELRARYAASAALGVLGWWLDRGCSESIETISKWAWALFSPLWFEQTTGESDGKSPLVASSD
jgi:AcrR family transcriptional regulator